MALAPVDDEDDSRTASFAGRREAGATVGFQAASAAAAAAAPPPPHSIAGEKPRKSRPLQGTLLQDSISAGAKAADTVPADDAMDENARPASPSSSSSSSSSSYEPKDIVAEADTAAVNAVVPAAPEAGGASKGGSEAREKGEREARHNAPRPFLAVNWNSVSKTAIRTTLGSRRRPGVQSEGLTKEPGRPAGQPRNESPLTPNEPGSSLPLGSPVPNVISDVVDKDAPLERRVSGARDDEKKPTPVEIIHIDSDSEDGDMMMTYSSANPPPTLAATAAGDSVLKHSNIPANPEPIEASPQLQNKWASQTITPKLSAAEKELQQRYFNIVGSIKSLGLQDAQGAAGNVNEASAEEPDIVYCLCCGNEGHVQQDCPELKCRTCASADTHFTYACPKNKPREGCEVCGAASHAGLDCGLLWRSYLPTEGRIRRVQWLPISCYSCGSNIHYGADCPHQDLRRRAIAVGTSFSRANASYYLDAQSEHVAIAAPTLFPFHGRAGGGGGGGMGSHRHNNNRKRSRPDRMQGHNDDDDGGGGGGKDDNDGDFFRPKLQRVDAKGSKRTHIRFGKDGQQRQRPAAMSRTDSGGSSQQRTSVSGVTDNSGAGGGGSSGGASQQQRAAAAADIDIAPHQKFTPLNRAEAGEPRHQQQQQQQQKHDRSGNNTNNKAGASRQGASKKGKGGKAHAGGNGGEGEGPHNSQRRHDNNNNNTNNNQGGQNHRQYTSLPPAPSSLPPPPLPPSSYAFLPPPPPPTHLLPPLPLLPATTLAYNPPHSSTQPAWCHPLGNQPAIGSSFNSFAPQLLLPPRPPPPSTAAVATQSHQGASRTDNANTYRPMPSAARNAWKRHRL